jgi:regulatory protein
MNNKTKKISKEILFSIGFKYLSFFPASSKHFREIMKKKIQVSYEIYKDPPLDESYGWLDEIIQKFHQMGLLNDEQFINGSIQTFKNKGLSKKMMHLKLQLKGIDEKSIDRALTEINDDDELFNLFKIMKRKKYGVFSSYQSWQSDLKQKSYFARNGFDIDLIQKGFSMSLEEALELLNR